MASFSRWLIADGLWLIADSQMQIVGRRWGRVARGRAVAVMSFAVVFPVKAITPLRLDNLACGLSLAGRACAVKHTGMHQPISQKTPNISATKRIPIINVVKLPEVTCDGVRAVV